MTCSVNDINYAVDPALNEIFGLIARGEIGQPFAKKVDEVLKGVYLKGFNNGIVTEKLNDICNRT